MRILLTILPLLICFAAGAKAETVRIPATADIWLSHATPRESETGSGGSVVFKLKSVEELAAIRFDLERVKDRSILGARLHLRSRSETAPRWLRVSTLTSRWVEGENARAYSGRDGATWKLADASQGESWAWRGSEFSDVCMGAGGSRVEVVELTPGDDGWYSTELPPALVTAMVCGASDGLALMDGGSPHNRNHYFHSVQSWESEPWLELELGDPQSILPPAPILRVEPAPELASLSRSAIWVHVRADSTDFAFRGWLNGEALDPWQLPRVDQRGELRFALRDLPPSSEQVLELSAVGPGGSVSDRARSTFICPPAMAAPPPLDPLELTPPALRRDEAPTLWALPPLSRIDPQLGELLVPDPRADGEAVWNRNPIWDGTRVRLQGARGETVAFQLVARARVCGDASGLELHADRLMARGKMSLTSERWSLREYWYRPRGGVWRASYLRPVALDEWILPALGEGLPVDASWRSFCAELRIPMDAAPGTYRGEFVVEFECGIARLLPVELELSELILPETPSFRIELNAYRIPEAAIEYFRLARAHRSVFTPWVFSPELDGEAPLLEVDWESYDAQLATLLDGRAFGPEDSRPLEVLYLPFWESWPIELSPRNYAFPEPWPERGDRFELLWDHHETAAPIEEALSPLYLQSLASVQRQFVDHFAQQGWQGTELHSFYGSKMSHFTRYGRRSFWNTDEPLYLADWQALRFFCERFEDALDPRDEEHWVSRADLSRPEWLEGALGDAARIVYIGGERSDADARRLRELSERLAFRWMVYGRASTEEQAPVLSAVWALEAFLDGASGALIWLSVGDEDSWRDTDPEEFPGTALMAVLPSSEVPAGDLRLLALREAQQMSGWLDAVAAREGLSRAQLDALITPSFRTPVEGWWRGKGPSDELFRRGTLHPHEWERLRRLLAQRWKTSQRLK